MWVCVGRIEQIEKPGQFIVRELLGESIIITSNAAGTVNAFYNVCRHRGTKLCEEHQGAFAGSIQCPYHAWTYDLDGRLIGAPHMDEVPHFAKSDYPLHRVHADVWDGHVFLNLSPTPQPLREQLSGLPEKFAAWRMQELRLGHRIVYDVQGQLEADHPELQRVPPLPEPAPRAQQALALSERRERAAAGHLHGRTDGSPPGCRNPVDGRQVLTRFPARTFRTGRSPGLLLRHLPEHAPQPAPRLHAGAHAVAAVGRTGRSTSANGTSTPGSSRGRTSIRWTRWRSGT